jgi:Ni/Co efflux regulator RcnB
MKRILLIAAAAASLVAATPSGEALAQGRGRDHGWSHRSHGGQERGRGDGDHRRDRWSDERPGRGREPIEERDRRYEPRRDDGPPPRMLRAPGPRRGGYLPDTYRGGVVDDYRAYRLRPPPRGFAWVRVGSGFALVDMADGRVYDMVQ